MSFLGAAGQLFYAILGTRSGQPPNVEETDQVLREGRAIGV